MKKILFYSVFAVMIMSFYGCPLSVNYPPGNPGTEKIDKALIGTWILDAESADFKRFTVTKKDDFSYDVEIFETGEDIPSDITQYKGWITELGGKTFFYVQRIDESTYYLYEYSLTDKNTLTSHNVSLMDGAEGVTSTEELLKFIKASMKSDDFLSEELTWTKQ